MWKGKQEITTYGKLVHRQADHGKITEYSYEETWFYFCSIVRSHILLHVYDLALLVAQ
jgi:hypothetical protein